MPTQDTRAASTDEDREEVDVIVLTRDGGLPPAPVRAAIARQGTENLSIRLHVVAGRRQPDDPNRFATIARARNDGKRQGSAPWLMFVDDDIVLGAGCIARLVAGLRARPEHAALAADCLGQLRVDACGAGESLTSPHVGMGAALFRRDVLAFLPFRWEEGRCECRCCADDLRYAGFAIDYLPGAEARHEPALRARPISSTTHPEPACARIEPSVAAAPRILATFNRPHFRKFLRLFVTTLRRCGNLEPVFVYAYGLLPSEQRRLASTPRIEAICRPETGICPAITRLRDFGEAVGRWSANTPVAYWDAGDVVFQAQLAPLWDLVRAHPDVLLAARESFGIDDNPVAKAWIRSIADPTARAFAFDRFSRSPYLNSGFAAGTARTMRNYFREAHRLIHSHHLRGSTDWGDQTTLNLYCHTAPTRWREVPRGWNFAVCRLVPGDVRLSSQGHWVSMDGTPIYVAHGNAKMLPQVELSHLHDDS